MAKTKLSRDAYDRLVAEHKQMTTEGRIKIANLIEAARALGDLKENGDYHAAKDDQGKMESRIRQIEAMLDDYEIVDTPAGGSTVEVGSTVGIKYEGDDEAEFYLIGSIEERTDNVPVMTSTSPLGAALLGKKVGDSVTFDAPHGGQLTVEVTEIR